MCCRTLVIPSVNQAGVWGGGLQRPGSKRMVLSSLMVHCSLKDRRVAAGEVAQDEFRDTTVPLALVSAELAHHGWVRTAASLIEFPALCSARGGETRLLPSRRDLSFEGPWCLPACANEDASTLGLKPSLPSCWCGSIQHQTRICEDCRCFS